MPMGAKSNHSRVRRLGALGLCVLLASPLAGATSNRSQVSLEARPASFSEHQRQCAGKEGWSDAAPPVRIFGNVYDVGTCGIVVLLITGNQGNVLIDAATADAVPSIIANIKRLGFVPSDIKVLLSSHEHIDHAGGLSKMQRLTGARLLAVAAARNTLESGIAAADDPQKDSLDRFAGSQVSRIVKDQEVVTLGTLRLTAHATPGHAPGSTTWSWRTCQGSVCRSMVYADSLSAISSDIYRFKDHPAYVAAFRASIAKIAGMKCDLVITPHPAASNLYKRLAGTAKLHGNTQCRDYAAANRAKLDQRLANEKAP